MLANTNNQYGSIAKFFHWIIFLLVLGLLLVGFFMEDLPKANKPFVYNAHKLTGVIVLCLMSLRVLWAAVSTKPEAMQDTPCWQRMAEKLVHLGLYVALIAMPLVGWLGSSAAGKAPHLGEWSWSLPIVNDKAFIRCMFDYHELIAYAILVLVTIHVVAALYHHYILKDSVLKRMLPGGRS